MKHKLLDSKFLGMDAKNKGFWFSTLAMTTCLIFIISIASLLTVPVVDALAPGVYGLSMVMHVLILLFIDLIFGIPLNIKYWTYVAH